MDKQREESTDGPEEARGFGGFLRSLLHGIPWSESAHSEYSFRIDPPEGRHMTIHNANGKTRVVGEERDDIEVFVEKRARGETPEAANEVLDEIELLSHEVAGHLEIEVEAPRRWKRHGSTDLVIHVPQDIEVAVVSANGRVGIEGLRSPVHARSSNGPITISDIIGDVQVFTSNAKVTCNCTSGCLKARSSNGKILLDQHRGSVDASTSNGIIQVILSEIGAEGVALATSNGRVILELPEGADCDVDIRVENGVIRNSLEIEQAAADDRSGRLRGRLGQGGVPIRLRTSNGTVSLR